MLKIETGLFCLQPAPVLKEWICGSKTLPEVEPKPEIDEGDYLMEQEVGTLLSPKQFHIFGYILEREKNYLAISECCARNIDHHPVERLHFCVQQ